MGILREARARVFPLFAALIAAATSLTAQGQDALPVGAGPTDRREFEAFFDGLLSGLMADRHVSGAVVLVVKDGAVFFAKGYGVADLATGRPVDPDTLFRAGSISKLFTATAVMQLVEQGKLDLNADVNQYLEGFRIPDAFGKPVTLANLLTHTGGFDDSFLGTTQPLGAAPIPLHMYLAMRMPRRVMPPGKLLSYSNHGLALAGYLVERASGQPFAEYMREHVLDPLGMTHSGFGLPASPPSSLAVGYDWKGDHYEPMGYDPVVIAPAADLYTACSLLFLATIVGIPFGGLLRRMAGEPRTGMPVAARVLAVVVASLDLRFLAGIGAGLATVNSDSLFGAIPLWLTALSLIPLVALPLSLGLPYFWVRSFVTHTWTAFEQFHYLALTLAVGFVGVFVWYWNLLGSIR
ncbi:MAG TPA: serine hydrolase domain-containing protein [Myxococcota bacterium]|nr:serine hydrolase domain-containing protein [Myxococcota bacterium]